MVKPETARESSTGEAPAVISVFAYSVVLLFFLQLLTSFVAANYAIGLLGNRVPPESASVLFLLSPLLLLLPGRWSRSQVRGLFLLVVITRLTCPLLNDTEAVLLVSGAGVSASLLLLPFLLRAQADDATPYQLAGSLALATSALIALRALGSGTDASTLGPGQLIAWPVGLLALWQLVPIPDARLPGENVAPVRVILTCLGLVASMTLLYFAFAAPNVLARWTGADYLMIEALILVALIGWCALLQFPRLRTLVTPRFLKCSTALLVGLLVLTVMPHQLHFPSELAAYPLPEPRTPEWAAIALVLTCLLSPVVILDFAQMTRQLGALNPSARRLGVGFALGGVFLAAIVFAQMLTTTYDYVPFIGPVFRDRFWAVIAVPAMVVLMATMAAPVSRLPALRPNSALLLGLTLVSLVAVAGAFYVKARPGAAPRGTSLTVVTYNLQQGYDAEGNRNFEGQLALLRSLNADVIAVQESDTGRVAGGNDDLVRYLADGLDLHSYFGPKTVTGTFGIALLSRYPILNPRTFYLFSAGEQPAVISAQIAVSEKTFDLLVTHLGNGGPLQQQEEVLSLARGSSDVVLLGDFNFQPPTWQYRVTTEALDDAWAKRWPSRTDGSSSSSPRRIDYVFVSPGLDVRDATLVENRESDHPALVVQLGW